MNMCCKFLVFGTIFLGLSLPAQARFYSNSANECFVDDSGNDWFWFCGAQSLSCRGTSVWKKNKVTWVYNGQSFKYGSNARQWCCGGTGSKSGRFYAGDNWITKTESVTETLASGTCTWMRKTNICGQIDNPNDKCTEATGNCTSGYVSHGGKCVPACADGQAFESTTSSTCVACEASPTQGIKNGNCIKCPANQFYNINTLSCVDRSTMVQVSNSAHDDCWMCSTPGAMYNCLKLVSNGGDLSKNAKLQAACSVGGKEADATDFKLPEFKTVNYGLFKLLTKIERVDAPAENK